MSTELMKQEAPATSPILSIIQTVIDKGGSMTDVAQLLAMHEQWEANEAKKAFNAAMAKFKQNPPKITKNKDVVFGQTKYSHATLDHVTDIITAALSAVGISHKWAVDQHEQIAVTCILTHEQGHSESTTLRAPADSSGSKNGIQAIGSTVTYLQRYTLLAATGMAAGLDDDGNGAEKPKEKPKSKEMDQAEYARLCELIEAAGTVESLGQIYFAACKDAKDIPDQVAIDGFAKVKNARYRELVPKPVGAK